MIIFGFAFDIRNISITHNREVVFTNLNYISRVKNFYKYRDCEISMTPFFLVPFHH